ncbi:hypothetical protein B0H13DRAFT_2337568 [Mycena leptocephala]|nr:hypothetical protein B0H13DRAFT_2337568 [Mycena leptocephala]
MASTSCSNLEKPTWHFHHFHASLRTLDFHSFHRNEQISIISTSSSISINLISLPPIILLLTPLLYESSAFQFSSNSSGLTLLLLSVHLISMGGWLLV